MFKITLKIGPSNRLAPEDYPPNVKDAIGMVGISMDTSIDLALLYGTGSPGSKNDMVYAAHEATLAFARFLVDVLKQMTSGNCMMCDVSDLDNLKESLYHRIQDAASLYLTEVYAADARNEPGPPTPPDWNEMFRLFAQENRDNNGP